MQSGSDMSALIALDDRGDVGNPTCSWEDCRVSIRRPGRAAVVVAIALVATTVLGVGELTSSAASQRASHALHGTNYLGDGLDTSIYVAGDGSNLWISNSLSGTVTELSEATGAVETIVHLTDSSGTPSGIAVDASHVWVVSFYGGQLTELSRATGAIESVISIPGSICPCDELTPLTAISDDGTDVWITELNPPFSGALVEVDAATGSVIRSATFGSGGEPFQPSAVASDGTDVWTAGLSGVDEFSAGTGSLLQQISGPSDDLQGASGIATDGTHVWVTTTDAVVELAESTGSFIRSISTPDLVGGASGISSDGTDVWAAMPNGVVEISESSGNVVRTLDGPRYGIGDATGVVSNGTDVWALDDSAGSLSELSATTGQLLDPVSSHWDLPNPTAVAVRGAHVWVLGTDALGAADPLYAGSLTELSSSTGQQQRFIGGRHDPLGIPYQLIDDGPAVWVLSGQGNDMFMTEFSTSTGARLRSVDVGSDLGQQPEFALSEGRLWVLASTLTSLSEYSVLTGRYLGEVSDGSIGLPNGIMAIAAYGSSVIAAGPTRLAVVSGSTGRLAHRFARPPYCLFPDCSISLVAAPNSVWALIDKNGPNSVIAQQYSLSTGATLRTLTAQSIGLADVGDVTVTGNALWVEGGTEAYDQDPVYQERSVTTATLEHTYSGGSLGFENPGAIATLGSQAWVANYFGDSVTEFPFAKG